MIDKIGLANKIVKSYRSTQNTCSILDDKIYQFFGVSINKFHLCYYGDCLHQERSIDFSSLFRYCI